MPGRQRDEPGALVPPDRGGVGRAACLKPPARAYRGFAFVAALTTTGIDPRAGVALQFNRGGAWRTAGRAVATGRTADVAIRLPRSVRPGRYPLRAQARVGDEAITSPQRSLRLRKPGRWTTSRRRDGRWSGKAPGLPVQFRVAGRGRTIRAGRFQLTLLCPTPGMVNPFTTQIADAPLTRAKIAPDGSFVFAGVVRDHASFVHGRIRGRRASGTASLSLGACTGSARFQARR